MTDDRWDWVGAIETYSGRRVDLLNFTADQIDRVDIAVALSNICRYNGHVPAHYSVAEHSVRVAFHTLILGAPEQVVISALLHDAAEAYVGDMVRPLKRTEAGAGHQQIEAEVARTILTAFGGLWPLPQQVHEADRAIYDWEVANIRTGRIVGWSASEARDRFDRVLDGLLPLPRPTV